MKATGSLLLLSMVAFLAPAFGDIVVLKDGTTVEGKILMRSKRLVLVKTSDGKQKEFSGDDIKEIRAGGTVVTTGGPSVPKATPTPVVRPVKPVPAAEIPAMDGTKAREKLQTELPQILNYMLKEPLAVWPEPEKQERATDSDPAGKDWKVLRQNGAMEFLEAAPAAAEVVKAWTKSRPTVVVHETVVGVGTFDKTPARMWVRMYWHESNQSWGSSHPNDMAFQHRQTYALAMLNAAADAVGGAAGRRIRDLWSGLLNSRAGSPKDENTVLAANRERSAELDQLATAMGSALGLGQRLARAWSLAIRQEPHITPGVGIAQRVQLAGEQEKILREVVDLLTVSPAAAP